MRLNLDDIARIAGVSRATVSRVINDHPDVSTLTREKVLQVIAENNFHPNPAARMLVTQRTQIIGIVIHNPIEAFTSFYSSVLMQGMNSVAQDHDYAVLMWWEESGAEKERFSRRILQQNRLMDGIILATTSMDAPLIDNLIELNLPFVMTERPNRYVEQISYVSIDNILAAKSAVEHLYKLGRRKIGHITGLMSNIDGLDRYTGYRQALEAFDLPFDERCVVDGAFSRRAGYVGMQELLRRGAVVDAVFVGNDDSAEGALRALQEAGICVPDDIAVVGFDDLPGAPEISRSLTTVHQPVLERGERAASLLFDLLEGRTKEPQHILLPTQLIVRQTCGAGKEAA